MYASLLGFVLVVSFLLFVAFCVSYLVWSDRYKTPEVLAVEVMQFSEQMISAISVLMVGLLAFLVVLTLTNFGLSAL